MRYIDRVRAIYGATVDLSATEVSILIGLADCADGAGRLWIKVSTLAAKLRITPRTCTRAIRGLAERGILTITERPGDRRGNLYELHLELLQEPEPEAAPVPEPTPIQPPRGDRRSGVTQDHPRHRIRAGVIEDQGWGDPRSPPIGNGSMNGSKNDPPPPPLTGRCAPVRTSRPRAERGGGITLQSVSSRRVLDLLAQHGVETLADLQALTWAQGQALAYGHGGPPVGSSRLQGVLQRAGVAQTLDDLPGAPPRVAAADPDAEAAFDAVVWPAVTCGRYPADPRMAQAIRQHLGRIADLGRDDAVPTKARLRRKWLAAWPQIAPQLSEAC